MLPQGEGQDCCVPLVFARRQLGHSVRRNVQDYTVPELTCEVSENLRGNGPSHEDPVLS